MNGEISDFENNRNKKFQSETMYGEINYCLVKYSDRVQFNIIKLNKYFTIEISQISNLITKNICVYANIEIERSWMGSRRNVKAKK